MVLFINKLMKVMELVFIMPVIRSVTGLRIKTDVDNDRKSFKTSPLFLSHLIQLHEP